MVWLLIGSIRGVVALDHQCPVLLCHTGDGILVVVKVHRVKPVVNVVTVASGITAIPAHDPERAPHQRASQVKLNLPARISRIINSREGAANVCPGNVLHR